MKQIKLYVYYKSDCLGFVKLDLDVLANFEDYKMYLHAKFSEFLVQSMWRLRKDGFGLDASVADEHYKRLLLFTVQYDHLLFEVNTKVFSSADLTTVLSRLVIDSNLKQYK